MSLNLTKLTADVNAHQNLSDQPALSANELKQAWDQPASDIKTYLNNTLTTEIQSQVATDIAACLASAKDYTDDEISGISQAATDISYDNTQSGISSNNVQGAIDSLKTSVNSASSAASSKIKYTDFAFTSTTLSGTINGGDSVTSTASLSKSGYYPLAIIGHSNSQDAVDIRLMRITARGNGTGTLSYRFHNEDYGNSRAYTIIIDIMWVKIS